MTLEDFMQAKSSILEKRWINVQIPSVWQVAQWGLRHVGIRGSKLSQQDIVILSNLEVCSDIGHHKSLSRHTNCFTVCIKDYPDQGCLS